MKYRESKATHHKPSKLRESGRFGRYLLANWSNWLEETRAGYGKQEWLVFQVRCKLEDQGTPLDMASLQYRVMFGKLTLYVGDDFEVAATIYENPPSYNNTNEGD